MRFVVLSGSAVLTLALSLTAFGGITAGCSSASKTSGFDNGTDGGGGGGGGGGGDDSGSFGPLGDGAPQPTCVQSPSNYDIPGNGCDDDGDGKVDNVAACDSALAVGGAAGEFVKALGLCQTTTATDAKWGVVSATYTNGHTSNAAPADGQHGLLPKFGNVVKPREGQMFGVLSSGWAREYDGQTLTKCTAGLFSTSGCFKDGVAMQSGKKDVPAGFPKPAPPCDVSTDTYDVINVKLEIKVPSNAKGLQFDFDFWSGEWPEYVCTTFNDAFIAYLSSQAYNAGKPDNISFDANKNPVSVNNGFFDRCTAGTQTGCMDTHTGTSVCPSGTSELEGTGFLNPGTYCGNNASAGGGATGWLTTQAPVKPGEVITLEFMIWDTGDARYDSSVILDNFQWVPGPVTTGTGRPPK